MGPQLIHERRRRTDVWWVGAVERVGTATVVALILLFFGGRFINTEQANRIEESKSAAEERRRMLEMFAEATKVISANTEAIEKLNSTLDLQKTEVHELGERLLALEKKHRGLEVLEEARHAGLQATIRREHP